MTNKEKKEDSFFICSFFKSIGTKVKLIVAGIGAALGFLFIVIFRSRMNNAKMLEYELKKIRSEINIENTREDIDKNNVILDDLNAREEEIKRKIFELESQSVSGDVSREELDKFFDERGF
jgi:tRNA A58 N-methylase Trm61